MLLNNVDIRSLCNLNDEKLRERRSPLLANALLSIPQIEVPMVSPYFPRTERGGVISYGESYAGYDMILGDELWVFKNSYGNHNLIDPKKFKDLDYLNSVFDKIKPGQHGRKDLPSNAYVIPPAPAYILGVSKEWFKIPPIVKGKVTGKSTYARCAVLVNMTPLEPGWEGNLTIEISSLSPCYGVLYAGEGIAQIEFELLTAPPEKDYSQGGAKYQGQTGVTVARVL